MAITLLAPLMLALAPLTPGEKAAVDATVTAIFAPYRTTPNPTAAWDYPIWSADVAALIAEWKTVMPEGEVDDLNDGDWLCLCQDWDSEKFRATLTSVRPQGRGVVLAAVRIDLGMGPARSARMVLRRQGGRWLIDDLFSRDFPRGLKQALRETIAADRRLAR